MKVLKPAPCFRPLRDLSFIEIVRRGPRSGLFRIINGRAHPERAGREMGRYVTRTRIATLILSAPLFSFTPRPGRDDRLDEF